jgi:uncharacterized membrane protein YeaQ/YmgE (transglycosylase-associated protein family)
MHLDVGQIVVWVIIGALAGTLAGKIMNKEKNFWQNLIIGLVGAIIGGFIFEALKIKLGLGQITISFDQLLAAFVGSILFILLLTFLKK